MLLVDSNLVLI